MDKRDQRKLIRFHRVGSSVGSIYEADYRSGVVRIFRGPRGWGYTTFDASGRPILTSNATAGTREEAEAELARALPEDDPRIQFDEPNQVDRHVDSVARERFRAVWSEVGETLWSLSRGESALIDLMVSKLDLAASLAYQNAIERESIHEHEPGCDCEPCDDERLIDEAAHVTAEKALEEAAP